MNFPLRALNGAFHPQPPVRSGKALSADLTPLFAQPGPGFDMIAAGKPLEAVGQLANRLETSKPGPRFESDFSSKDGYRCLKGCK